MLGHFEKIFGNEVCHSQVCSTVADMGTRIKPMSVTSGLYECVETNENFLKSTITRNEM
jgi:hypothetical protein